MKKVFAIFATEVVSMDGATAEGLICHEKTLEKAEKTFKEIKTSIDKINPVTGSSTYRYKNTNHYITHNATIYIKEIFI